MAKIVHNRRVKIAEQTTFLLFKTFGASAPRLFDQLLLFVEEPPLLNQIVFFRVCR
jgi:hypothetical protein